MGGDLMVIRGGKGHRIDGKFHVKIPQNLKGDSPSSFYGISFAFCASQRSVIFRIIIRTSSFTEEELILPFFVSISLDLHRTINISIPIQLRRLMVV